MKTRFNKNGTVSIQQMPKETYWAIRNILLSAKMTFELNEEENEYWSNDGFICSLSKNQKRALDDIDWDI